METVWSLSAVGVGSLRGAAPSTRGFNYNSVIKFLEYSWETVEDNTNENKFLGFLLSGRNGCQMVQNIHRRKKQISLKIRPHNDLSFKE